MAFNWKSLFERLDPRKLRLPAYAQMRDFAVANRTTILSTALALLVGLWGGAVLGAGGGGPVFNLGAVGSVGSSQPVRAENAPRAGLPQVAGMQFVRLRTEMNQATPRACLEFSQNLSRDPSIHYADYLTIDPTASYSVDVSGNLLCLGGLTLNPERQVTVKRGLPSASGERTTYR